MIYRWWPLGERQRAALCERRQRLVSRRVIEDAVVESGAIGESRLMNPGAAVDMKGRNNGKNATVDQGTGLEAWVP